MKRIIVLNQYFYPDLASTGQYAFDICRALAEKGFEVNVVTSQPCYSEFSLDAPEEEHLLGIRIYRISLGGIKGRHNLKTRIKGYLKYLFGAWKKSVELLRIKKFDVVITFHNPPFIGLIGAIISARYNKKFIYIPYDLHPDILVKSGWRIPFIMIIIWEIINKFIYKRATKIIVLGERMKKVLLEKYEIPKEKIHVIPLWAKPEIMGQYVNCLNDNIRISSDEFSLKLLYAGNMGILHPIEQILEAAKELENYSIKFIFIGDGIKKFKIINFIEKERLKNIELYPYLPEDKFVSILNSVDACFVVIGKGLEDLALPSRLFTFLSAGKPIITIAEKNSEIARIVESNYCGKNVRDSYELVEILKDLLRDQNIIIIWGTNSYKAYYKYYNKEKILNEYEKIIQSV